MAISQVAAAPEDEAEAPALMYSRQRWWLLVLLFTVMLIGYAHRGALSVAVPFLSTDLGLSKASIGLLGSAFFWTYSFMQMPAGWLVDRFGVRRAYSLGFIFWSLSSALTGLATGVVSLLGFRIALGTGQAILFPAAARASVNWFQERERGKVTGIYLTGVRIGQALISAFGAWYLARYSWESFFIVTGLVSLVWLLPWMRFLGKWEKNADPVAGAKAPGSTNPSFLKSLLLLKDRSVLGIFLGFFAYDYVWYVFITWLPGYLSLERKFTPAEMGLYSSVPFLLMSVSILLSGTLSDWLVKRGLVEANVRRVFITIGLAVGCAIVPAGMVEDKMTAVWLLTISLVGLGIASPNTWTLTQAVCQKKIVGTVSGIQNFGGNLGGALAPALTGFIAHATNSFALAFAVAGVILVAGILAYWLLITKKVEMSEVSV
jgi:MFS transporter, ACS family, D-galactonate transporter